MTTDRHQPLTRRPWAGVALAAVLLLVASCGQATNPGAPAADDGALSQIETPTETPGAPPTEEIDPPTDDVEPAGPPVTDDEYCPEAADWDTAPETTDMTIAGAITGLSGGSTSCIDSVNFMLDPSDQEPSYAVQYVTEASWQGSGEPLDVAGGAVLEVTIGSPLVDESAGDPEFIKDSAAEMAEFNSFFAIEGMAFAGSFEGMTTFAMGVSSELPFRVETNSTSDGSPYLTVSVAHQPAGGFGPEDQADNAGEYGSGNLCDDLPNWTTSPETTDLSMGGPIVGIAAGNMGCFEELSIIVSAGSTAPGFDIRYTDTVRQEGSGDPVPVAGGAALQVVIGSPAYDPDTMEPTLDVSNPDDVIDIRGNFDELQQIAFAGSFEGMTTFAVGMAREVPFTVDVTEYPGDEYYLTIRFART